MSHVCAAGEEHRLCGNQEDVSGTCEQAVKVPRSLTVAPPCTNLRSQALEELNVGQPLTGLGQDRRGQRLQSLPSSPFLAPIIPITRGRQRQERPRGQQAVGVPGIQERSPSCSGLIVWGGGLEEGRRGECGHSLGKQWPGIMLGRQ